MIITLKGADFSNNNLNVKHEIWYTPGYAEASTKNAKTSLSATSFITSDTSLYKGKPINAIKIAVAQAGTITFGLAKNDTKVDNKKWTIQVTNPSKEVQVINLPTTITLGENENIWWQESTDTGLWWYSNNQKGQCNFWYRWPSNKQYTDTQNLSIDYGYINNF